MNWQQGYNAVSVAHLVRTALEKEDLTTAIELCHELNQRAPDYGPGWHLAAEIALLRDNPASALAMAKRSLACQADSAAELLVVECHCRLGQYREGRAAARVLGHGLPPSLALKRAELLLALHCPDDAAAQYRYLLETEGANPTLLSALADVLSEMGQLREAEQVLDQAIQLAPQQDALWTQRAYLRKQSEANHHIETLQFAIARRDRPCPQLHFALAKEWADLRCEDAAWHNLHLGARQQQAQQPYDASRDLSRLRAIRAHWSAPASKAAETTAEGPQPLFLIGLPDGAIDALADHLAQHPQVFHLGAHQRFLPELERQLARQARLRDRPLWSTQAKLAASAQLDPAALGQAYLASLPPEAEEARWVIDTSPQHDQHLGLLLRALPHARAIAPLAPLSHSGAALYQADPRQTGPYRYDPIELARYLKGHRALMQHWQRCHPEQLLCLDLNQPAGVATEALWHHLGFAPPPPSKAWPFVRPWGDIDSALPELLGALGKD
ncbi:Tetratricopeptide TPR_2 repeat protein [Ferrimonas balearica DSM 9799]|uniref:Tetratricopeptide TPR_2 repeat protein n=1 Tax=Ferrimonas balearica (strain DSM 9799 / CCM 4581 / KCTC 23876 / PAT) TaxID=550540 RepID=E1SNZ5_FERBD|nr:tetratricopeptide repeat-containing sulfotransferase family protein [Ferrimonas balearica]ADN74644.1 Tetratricopeptide TPR_2 repeat protein [Ferrimonas balearica DSM 9799]